MIILAMVAEIMRLSVLVTEMGRVSEMKPEAFFGRRKRRPLLKSGGGGGGVSRRDSLEDIIKNVGREIRHSAPGGERNTIWPRRRVISFFEGEKNIFN
jgi:hypothetical protein